MQRRLEVGSIIKILEQDHLTWYAHYVHFDPRNGTFIQVYRCKSDVSIDQITSRCEKAFPEVLCSLSSPIREGRWEVVGIEEPPTFKYPQFLMQGAPQLDGGFLWWIYDGVEERPMDGGVPVHLQDLETLTVWSAVLLEERIMSGKNPFSYENRQSWPNPFRR